MLFFSLWLKKEGSNNIYVKSQSKSKRNELKSQNNQENQESLNLPRKTSKKKGQNTWFDENSKISQINNYEKIDTIQIFTSLYKFLYKLFLNINYVDQDMVLTPLEKQIIVFILKKKKFHGFENIEFTASFFNRARQTKLTKKNEDGLKFIFKKALKEIKRKFKKEHQLTDLSFSIDKFDELFYGYFFKKVAEREGIKLECFYHFRNWKSRTSIDIPKSVTRRYLKRLKKNPEFMGKILYFLNNQFWHDFYRMNSIKIQHLIIKWEQFIQGAESNAAGMSLIEKSITGRGNKLPWTIFEARNAFNKTLDSIDKA